MLTSQPTPPVTSQCSQSRRGADSGGSEMKRESANCFIKGEPTRPTSPKPTLNYSPVAAFGMGQTTNPQWGGSSRHPGQCCSQTPLISDMNMTKAGVTCVAHILAFNVVISMFVGWNHRVDTPFQVPLTLQSPSTGGGYPNLTSCSACTPSLINA